MMTGFSKRYKVVRDMVREDVNREIVLIVYHTLWNVLARGFNKLQILIRILIRSDRELSCGSISGKLNSGVGSGKDGENNIYLFAEDLT